MTLPHSTDTLFAVVSELKYLSSEQFLLMTLVVKLAVIALLATVLVRYWRFRQILIFERRGWLERLIMVASMGIPVSAGVAARLLLNYNAADLTLEAPFVVGLIAGPYAGALVGLMAGSPALIAGEFIALPFAVGCGFAGGGLREAAPKEAIWRFSPFVFTQLPRRIWRFVNNPALDWQVTLLLAPVALELLRQALGSRYPDRLFHLGPELNQNSPLVLLVMLATVLCVATPIKIWNNARIEHRLQEQEKLLLAAKIEALASQINPHFLFNTLTSISSLIRSHPETARMLIGKLSGLLRRLLRSHDHFVTLREEMESIDEYLDIEVVRFGPSLKVEKHLSPDTLEILVPSMILQPLVENSIKHGFSRKVGGGRILIRSRLDNGLAIIEVEDDGTGMSEERLSTALGGGIGLSNVNERLRVIYGEGYGLKLTSRPDRGTSARIEIPELALVERVTA
ncbi:MAG TPA: histidine kinase [Vicinamibacterales bacterium]